MGVTDEASRETHRVSCGGTGSYIIGNFSQTQEIIKAEGA